MPGVQKQYKGCTEAQITMIEAFLAGASKHDAYLTAFPEKVIPENQIHTVIKREFAKKEVMAEIERRNKVREKALEKRAESEIERINKLWSREDSVRHLVDIISDCERTRKHRGVGGKDEAVVTRLERDTVDSLNKMLGYDAPIKIDADSKVTVSFDTGSGDQSAGEDDWTG